MSRGRDVVAWHGLAKRYIVGKEAEEQTTYEHVSGLVQINTLLLLPLPVCVCVL